MRTTKLVMLGVLIALLSSYATVKFAGNKGNNTADSSSDSAFERVKKSGVIRCGYTTWPPGLIKDVNTGKLSGINYEVMEEIGKELDLKIEWTEEVGFGNYIEGLNTNRYDAVCTTNWPDPARIRYQTFSRPYYFSPIYAYVRADDHRFDGHLDKINDPSVKIAAIDGDISQTAARIDFPKASVLTMPQISEAQELFLTIITKKADVFFSDQGNFNMFNKSNPGKMRRVEGVSPSRVYGEFLVVKYGETHLRDMINVALTQLINSGKIEKIVNHIEPGVYKVPQPDYKN